MKYKKLIKFIVLTLLLLLISEILKAVLGFDKLLQNSLAEQLTTQQIENYFEFQEKWDWVGYLFVPLFLVIKISMVASVVYVGTFFFSSIEVSFSKIWNAILNAEFIFLLVPICKMFWFYFLQNNFTLQDFQNFYPLSAINITGYKGLSAWFIYPFQTFNLFEIAYIFYLSFQIGSLTQTNADNGLKIMCYSYLPALFLWVAIVMFLTLNYS